MKIYLCLNLAHCTIENIKSYLWLYKKAKEKATAGHYDVLLIDTAGRLAIDDELMAQLEDVKKTVAPDEIFYVADSLTGHDATRTATTFKDSPPITNACPLPI